MILQRNKLKGDIVIDTLVDILASDTATLTNPTKLSNSFISHSIKTNANTISTIAIIKIQLNFQKQILCAIKVANAIMFNQHIQFLIQKKTKQEQASLDRINDSFKKVIVVQDNIASWHNEKSYLTINILDFLLNPNSLEL